MKRNSIKETIVTKWESLVSMKTSEELKDELWLMYVLLYMRTMDKENNKDTDNYINKYIKYFETKERVTDRKKDIIKSAILEFDSLIRLYDENWGEDLFGLLQVYRYILTQSDYNNISKSEMSVRYSAILTSIAIAYSKDEPIEEANKIYMKIIKEGLNKGRIQNKDREFINNES